MQFFFQSAAYYGKDSFLVRPFVATALMGSSIYVTKTVSELLFDGYPDSILSMSKYFSVSSPYGVPDKFGWFYIVSIFFPFLCGYGQKIYKLENV